MRNNIKQALVLAGGKGMRLRPYTTVLPKPMMPIDNMPILEIVFRQLKSYGFESVILAVGYMEHLFRAYFGNGQKFGINISYSIEDKPLGTAGPLSLVIDKLEEDFLVMNGDLLTTINYEELSNFHLKNSASATIALHQRSVDIDYGVIKHNKNNICYDPIFISSSICKCRGIKRYRFSTSNLHKNVF